MVLQSVWSVCLTDGITVCVACLSLMVLQCVECLIDGITVCMECLSD